jgi:predicted acylesterase/phospholipase RssA
MKEFPKRLALSLSGGGFRAAAFHLGALDTLERLGLLSKMVRLSTISGGTLTGIALVQTGLEEKTFLDFTNKLRAFLNDPDLVSLALGNLAGGLDQGRGACPTAIRAFADVYDDRLTNRTRFAVLSKIRLGDPARSSFLAHLEEVSFNATDFRHGLPFRFQTSTNPKVLIGNHYASIQARDADFIRLADIAAASSCFPVGFEPMGFPQEFVWPQDQAGQEARERVNKKLNGPIALMDGGVVDNQGMGTLIRSGIEPDMLYIFSDASRELESLYEMPTSKVAGRLAGRSIGSLKSAWQVMIAWSAGGMFISALCLASLNPTGILGRMLMILASLVLVACAIVFGSLILAQRLIRSALAKTPLFGLGIWHTLKKLRLGEVWHLLRLRATSLKAMTGDVYMKRIRALIYGSAYENEELRPNLVTNLIYDLNRTPTKLLTHVAPELVPNQPMKDLARQCAAMPTTLWFEHPEQFDQLVLCGQLTMCHKILEWLLHRNQDEPPDVEFQTLGEKAKSLHEDLAKAVRNAE